MRRGAPYDPGHLVAIESAAFDEERAQLGDRPTLVRSELLHHREDPIADFDLGRNAGWELRGEPVTLVDQPRDEVRDLAGW